MVINKILKKIRYYFWASYRRKILDRLLELNQEYFRGIVLDIGGRDRGKFIKPKSRVKKWIFADVVENHHPDLLLDVTDMEKIGDEEVDVILALELFEHVSKPEKGLAECYRVLKNNGTFIISAPFLYGLHADPYDYQRWTDRKWKDELLELGFKIEKIINMGTFFTVLFDAVKNINKKNFFLIRYLIYLSYPLLDIIVCMDQLKIIRDSPLGKYIGGYFIIVTKE